MKKRTLFFTLLILYSFCNNQAIIRAEQELYLVVVRHGHAEHLLDDVRSSRVTSPPKHLTTKGVEEIINTTARLKEEGLTENNILMNFTSPLARTQETAVLLQKYLTAPGPLPIKFDHLGGQRLSLAEVESLNKELVRSGNKITADNRIIERDMGDYEGQCFSSEAIYNNPGEDYLAVKNRTIDFLEMIKKTYLPNNFSDKKYILICTHDIIAKNILEYFNPKELDSATLATGEFRILKFKKDF